MSDGMISTEIHIRTCWCHGHQDMLMLIFCQILKPLSLFFLDRESSSIITFSSFYSPEIGWNNFIRLMIAVPIPLAQNLVIAFPVLEFVSKQRISCWLCLTNKQSMLLHSSPFLCHIPLFDSCIWWDTEACRCVVVSRFVIENTGYIECAVALQYLKR